MTHCASLCVTVIAETPAETTPKKTKTSVVVVPDELHAALKSRAKAEGMVLQKMVEKKLRELVEPSPLRIVSAQD